MSRSSNDPQRGARGFTLVECMVGVLVLSLMAVGFMKLTATHERIVGDLEIARAGATSGKVQRRKDPYQRVLGARATRTGGVPQTVDTLGIPDQYLVDVTSVEHLPSQAITTAIVTLDCYHGQLDPDIEALVTSVWDLDEADGATSVVYGALSEGVISSQALFPSNYVRLSSSSKAIEPGTYHLVSDSSSFNRIRLTVDTGLLDLPVDATRIGQTSDGLWVWEFDSPYSGTLDELDVRRNGPGNSFSVSLIEECVVDDLL